MTQELSLRKRAGLGMLVAMLILLGLEVLARLVVAEEDLLFTWEHPQGLIRIAGEHVLVAPSQHSEHSDGPYLWRVTTNAQGLREVDEIPVVEQEHRILALGDSWIFGFGVDQGKTIADQLERLLPQRLGASRVEVVNAGIPGASGFDMLARWRELRALCVWHGVLLGTPHNDPRQTQQQAQRSRFYAGRIGGPYLDWRLYLMVRHRMALRHRPAEPSGESRRLPGHTAGAASEDLGLIAKEAGQLGIPVTMVEMPVAWHHTAQGRSYISPRYRQALEPMGVRFAGHLLDERSCWGFEDRFHPSEAGARALAEVAADLLTSSQSEPLPRSTPRCSDVPGMGPGKEFP